MESETKAVYPIIEVTDNIENGIRKFEILTHVRKKADGVWWLIPVKEEIRWPKEQFTETEIRHAYQRINFRIHAQITVGKVSLDLVDSGGQGVHVMDINQESESDRIRNQFKSG